MATVETDLMRTRLCVEAFVLPRSAVGTGSRPGQDKCFDSLVQVSGAASRGSADSRTSALTY